MNRIEAIMYEDYKAWCATTGSDPLPFSQVENRTSIMFYSNAMKQYAKEKVKEAVNKSYTESHKTTSSFVNEWCAITSDSVFDKEIKRCKKDTTQEILDQIEKGE